MTFGQPVVLISEGDRGIFRVLGQHGDVLLVYRDHPSDLERNSLKSVLAAFAKLIIKSGPKLSRRQDGKPATLGPDHQDDVQAAQGTVSPVEDSSGE